MVINIRGLPEYVEFSYLHDRWIKVPIYGPLVILVFILKFGTKWWAKSNGVRRIISAIGGPFYFKVKWAKKWFKIILSQYIFNSKNKYLFLSADRA